MPVVRDLARELLYSCLDHYYVYRNKPQETNPACPFPPSFPLFVRFRPQGGPVLGPIVRRLDAGWS